MAEFSRKPLLLITSCRLSGVHSPGTARSAGGVIGWAPAPVALMTYTWEVIPPAPKRPKAAVAAREGRLGRSTVAEQTTVQRAEQQQPHKSLVRCDQSPDGDAPPPPAV